MLLTFQITHYAIETIFLNIYNRTETARRSCIPSSVTYWNSIRANIREADTYLYFRKILKDEVLYNANVPSYFLKGQRKLSVLHARIRNSCSDLKSDLFQKQMTRSALVAMTMKMPFITFLNVVITLIKE